MKQIIPISVLDLSPILKGSTPGQAFRNSLDLARHAENRGYKRYWLAEHHNMPGMIVGSREKVQRGLGAFIEKTGVDELMVTGQIFDHASRLRSFEIVAEVAMQNSELVSA